MRPRGVTGPEPTFVGRDGELAALEAEFDEAGKTGQVRLVTLLGDAGVGKTRLVGLPDPVIQEASSPSGLS
jgi:hypothetical protein